MRKYNLIVVFFSLFLLFKERLAGQAPGVLYGMSETTWVSGGYGFIFSYDVKDSSFSPFKMFNSTNGANPYGNLMQATNGLLYGMTYDGGKNGYGTFFSLDPSTNIQTTLLNFNDTNGGFPYGSLVQAPNGLLYGMTLRGGLNNEGVLFSYDITKNQYSVLFSFNNNSGYNPYGNLIFDNGLLYGMTEYGGANLFGTLFSFNPSTDSVSVLLNFVYTKNGGHPYGSLLKAANGLLYSMTSQGGNSPYDGTLFSFNPANGKDSVYLTFNNSNGSSPNGSLIQATDGFLYGLTEQGGLYGNGVLFKFDTLTGIETVLFSFKDTTTGANPYGSLIQANNGLFYGMTNNGGLYNSGTLFSFNPGNNEEIVVRNFNKDSDCLHPYGDLMEAMSAKIIVKSNNLCYGDSSGFATMVVRGGHYPLTYNWSNGSSTDTVTGLKAGNYTAKVTDQKGITYSFSFTIKQPPLLKDSIRKLTNVLCYGNSNGSATIAVSGGIKPYSFSWSSGLGTNSSISGVPAGTYTFAVKDSNGCMALRTVNIIQPTALRDSIDSVRNVTCFGQNTGRAVININGGVKPYTYLWTPTAGTNYVAANLSAGSYTCVVKDSNGCIKSDTVTITSPSKITPTATTSPTPCTKNEGTATITSVSGGIFPYAYLWSNGITNATDTGLAAGSYTCTITDSFHCSVTDLIVVPNTGGPVDSITSKTNVTCYGDSNGGALVNVTGGKIPYTFLWSPYGGNNTKSAGLIAGTYTFTATDSTGCIGTATVIITQPQAIRDSLVKLSNVSCFGGNNGSAEVGVKGGTKPYIYNWSSGKPTGAFDSLLTIGSYTCTITDTNNCAASKVFVTITSPQALNVDTSATIAKCGSHNGTASVLVSGGTKPYTYSWSNSATTSSISNLIRGQYYCLIIDSQKCFTKVSVIVSDTGGPKAIIASQVNENCYGNNNGSAIVNVTTGIPPYSYSWSNGTSNIAVSSLKAGSYTCTVTDSTGCTGSAVAIITQPTEMITVIKTTGVCNGTLSGGTADINVSGGMPPYSLSWSNGSTNDTIANAAPGSYFCKVTDSTGCVVYANCTISPSAPMAIDSIVSKATSCSGCSDGNIRVYVSGGIPPGDSVYYYYVWSNGITGAPIITGIDSGYYSVCITSPYGCGSTCDSTSVVSGIRSALRPDNYFNVFPVPSSGLIYLISSEPGENKLTVSDELGKIMFTRNVNVSSKNETLSIDLGYLPDGIYIMHVTTTNSSGTRRVIIQK